jgi:hypothetical protein
MMFLRGLLVALVPAIVVSDCLAATPTPEEIIAAFFGPAGISDKAAYYTGEMKEHYLDKPTLGEGWQPGVTFATRRLPLSRPEAPVYSVDLRLGALISNWYAFFGQEGGDLKLKAVRTLGPTALPCTAIEDFEELTKRAPERVWTYRNLSRFFRTDSDLITYFRSRISELDTLRSMIEDQEADSIRTKMHSMCLSGWERDQYGNLTIWIGGVSGNDVGIMYVPDGKPPSLSENEYIYIEQIDGPWYLYKSS